MTIVDTYTLQIVNDNGGYHGGISVNAIMGASVVRQILEETEENLNDLLPPGYRARIRRWNDPNPEGEPSE